MSRGIDGASIIRVFRCECGKAHLCAFVSPSSVCRCGARLWPQVWSNGR